VDPSAAAGAYRSIQSAVDALPLEGPCRISVAAGTYHETVSVVGKNSSAQSVAQQLTIEGHPGTVLVAAGEHALVVSASRFITIEGLTLTGARGSAVLLDGESPGNSDITVARNDIHNNGMDAGGSGVEVAAGNTRAWIVNNLLRSNGQNGVDVQSGAGRDGSVYIANNTIVGNAWNGLAIGRGQTAFVVNNLITGNGIAAGSSAGRWGIRCNRAAGPGTPELITLMHNTLYGNGGAARGAGGDIGDAAQILDPTDAGNRTTRGGEGAGVVGCAIDGCTGGSTSSFFVPGAQGVWARLRADSPAAGRGLASFLRDGREWVPSVDFERKPRPSGGPIDAGADQVSVVK
jgi:hypothetical protein